MIGDMLLSRVSVPFAETLSGIYLFIISRSLSTQSTVKGRKVRRNDPEGRNPSCLSWSARATRLGLSMSYNYD